MFKKEDKMADFLLAKWSFMINSQQIVENLFLIGLLTWILDNIPMLTFAMKV